MNKNFIRIVLFVFSLFCFSPFSSVSAQTARPVPTPERRSTPAASGVQTEPELTADDYYKRGNECYDKQDYPCAIENLTKVTQLAPTFAPAYVNRGNAYDDSGNTNAAIADYTKAIQIDPKSDFAYFNRGITYSKTAAGYDSAIRDVTKAIELNPNYRRYFVRGNVYLLRAKSGDVAAAVEDYTKSIQLKADEAQTYKNRALAYRKLGKTAQADADEAKAAQLDPSFIPKTPTSNAKRFVITDAGQLYSTINNGDCIDWSWASPTVRNLAGEKGWAGSFYPKNGDEGEVVFEGKHCNSGIKLYVLKIGSYYAVMGENGVRLSSGGASPISVKRGVITNNGKIYPTINQTTCLDWSWSTPAQKSLSGSNGWGNYYPQNGNEGEIVFETMHCDKTTKMYVLKVGTFYVPIAVDGVRLTVGSSPGTSNLVGRKITISDVGQTYSTINTIDCLDWAWATPAQKQLSGKGGWAQFYPRNGDTGEIVAVTKHCDSGIAIYIVKIGNYYVPLGATGVRVN